MLKMPSNYQEKIIRFILNSKEKRKKRQGRVLDSHVQGHAVLTGSGRAVKASTSGAGQGEERDLGGPQWAPGALRERNVCHGPSCF